MARPGSWRGCSPGAPSSAPDLRSSAGRPGGPASPARPGSQGVPHRLHAAAYRQLACWDGRRSHVPARANLRNYVSSGCAKARASAARSARRNSSQESRRSPPAHGARASAGRSRRRTPGERGEVKRTVTVIARICVIGSPRRIRTGSEKSVSGNLSNQFGVGLFSHRVPFIRLLDPAKSTVAASRTIKLGRIQKSHSGAAGL
jgi:hypothetical protein